MQQTFVLGNVDATFESKVRRGCQQEFPVEQARAARQFPASAGSRTISAATQSPIQIRKFFACASSVVFMMHPLVFRDDHVTCKPHSSQTMAFKFNGLAMFCPGNKCVWIREMCADTHGLLGLNQL
jgi:hypothetical protein